MTQVVLLVEPNKDVAEIVEQFLTKDGFKVLVAHSAQKAIHQADKSKPDIVVLELAMPMHNGFAFLHEFRSYSDWAEIPIIVHSHLAREEAAASKSWKVLGAKYYLYKPNTTLNELRNKIKDTLSGDEADS